MDELPEGGITVYSLKALDFVAPGEWQNITDFNELVRSVTRESDEDFLQAFLDMSTNYCEHTGTQSLAKRLIQRAMTEI